MALWSTQPLTEMNSKESSWRKERPERKADNLTAICWLIFQKMCEASISQNRIFSINYYRDNFILYKQIRSTDIVRSQQLSGLLQNVFISLLLSIVRKRAICRGNFHFRRSKVEISLIATP
jgi:hypothetical protein